MDNCNDAFETPLRRLSRKTTASVGRKPLGLHNEMKSRSLETSITKKPLFSSTATKRKAISSSIRAKPPALQDSANSTHVNSKGNATNSSRVTQLRRKIQDTIVSPRSLKKRPKNGPDKTYHSISSNGKENSAGGTDLLANKSWAPSSQIRTDDTPIKSMKETGSMSLLTEIASAEEAENPVVSPPKPLGSHFSKTEIDEPENRSPQSPKAPENDLRVSPCENEAPHTGKSPPLQQGDTTSATFRTRGNGVELDFSEMFSDAGTRVPSKTPVKSTSLNFREGQKEMLTEREGLVIMSKGANSDNTHLIDFGAESSNVVGQSRTRCLTLQAPQEKTKTEYLVSFDKVNFRKCLFLSIDDDDAAETNSHNRQTFRFRSGENKKLNITWKPIDPGFFKCDITLNLPLGKLQLRVIGRARRNQPLENHVTFEATSPQPRISTAFLYNQDGAEQECEMFTEFLNYTLQPMGEDDCCNGSLVEEPNCSTNQVGLKTFVLHQQMAQLRRKSCDLFRSDQMYAVRRIIDEQTRTGGLSVRHDRDMYADLTLRKTITSLMLSYSTPWLRLGLETIFGEVISPDHPIVFSPKKKSHAGDINRGSRTGSLKFTLKRFIVQRVLSDPATLRKYTKGKCKVPSGPFERRYREDLRKHSLNRILLLVFFLDRAKETNIVENAGNLFIRGSDVKSSRDVLVAFCREFLSSEGDIIKHLSRLGLTVRYKQDHIDEIDFSVTNLAIDLRDGARLARVAEILNDERPRTILSDLRLPAVSRLQKLRNIKSVLQYFRYHGVPNIADFSAHHIVDGHREMVLKLLWSVVARFKLDFLLNSPLIEQEIRKIYEANKFSSCCSRSDSTAPMQARGSFHLCENQSYSLLLRWSQAVCSLFGVAVKNLTSSFADGKAFLFLLHYYVPGLVRLRDILPTTTDLSPSVSSEHGSYTVALKREQQNSALTRARMADIGGVPLMIGRSDSKNIPDEKVVVLTLACLFSRLTTSRNEINATIVIQRWYKKCLHKMATRKKQAAAAQILISWRRHKENYYEAQRRLYADSVKVLERFFFQFKERLVVLWTERCKRDEQQKAATLIQAHVRMAQSKHWAAGLRKIICAQSACRCYLVRKKMVEQRAGAVLLQGIWRSFLAQIYYHMDRLDIITVQSIFRRNAAMRDHSKKMTAVRLLQRNFRSHIALVTLDALRRESAMVERRQSVLTIQMAARRLLASFSLSKRRRAVILIQSAFRLRRDFRRVQILKLQDMQSRKHHAAVLFQGFARMFLAVQRFNECRARAQAATHVQRRWRMVKLRDRFKIVRWGVIRVQASVRTMLARRACSIRFAAANRLQTSWRRYKAKSKYDGALEDIVVVQSAIRRRLACVRVRRRKYASAVIARSFLCFIANNEANKLRCERAMKDRLLLATQRCQAIARQTLSVRRLQVRRERINTISIIQRWWRARCVIFQTIREREAIIMLQALFRKFIARERKVNSDVSALRIQKSWRRHRACHVYKLSRVRIILCQRSLRYFSAIRKLKKRKQAVSRLQRGARSWIARQKVKEILRAKAEEALLLGYRRNESAVQLQSYFRRHLVQRELSILSFSAVVLQRVWRSHAASREYQADLIDIIIVQRAVRRRAAIVKVEHAIEVHRGRACVMIQSHVRRRFARRDFHVHLSAVKLQKTWRKFILYVNFNLYREGARVIQSEIRRFLDKRNYDNTIDSAIVIQSFARRILGCRKIREATSASAIQRWFRRCQLFRRSRLEEVVVTVVQSLFRARRVRKNTVTEVQIAAHRIKIANDNSRKHPERRLGAQTFAALNVLRSSKKMTEILKAAEALELSTRLSKECCILVARANAPAVMYHLVGSCNRSLPHLEFIAYVLLTLKNIAKQSPLVPLMATGKSVDVFLGLVQMYRDKGEIFHHAASLLETVTFSSEELMAQCGSKENLKRLKRMNSNLGKSLSASSGAKQGSASSIAVKHKKKGMKILAKIIAILEGCQEQ